MRISRANKVDANQAQIVRDLRQFGASVQDLSSVGGGCPDLLVAFRGVNYLVEVKNKGGRGKRLTEQQVRWQRAWRGQVAVCMCFDDVLKVITEEK